MQVVAWAKMFSDYSAVMPVAHALKLTFDGSQPCNLCELSQGALDEARERAPQSAPFGGGEKLVLIAQVSPSLVVTPVKSSWPEAADEFGRARPHAVPVPPPRA